METKHMAPAATVKTQRLWTLAYVLMATGKAVDVHSAVHLAAKQLLTLEPNEDYVEFTDEDGKIAIVGDLFDDEVRVTLD